MKNLKPNLIIVRILTNYMRYMKKGWRYIIDNKVTNKLKSIAVNTYILTVFFWIVLTTSMILLLLIVIDLSDVIKSSSIWLYIYWGSPCRIRYTIGYFFNS